MSDIWPLVHAERHALIEDLAGLTPQQWQTPSLADGWSVHEVVAHLVDNAMVTPWRLILAMVKARGDFHRQNRDGLVAAMGATPAQTLDRLRAAADRTSGPPAPVASRLVEEIAHGEDIRRPLGIRRDYPVEAICPGIRYQLGTPDVFDGRKSLTKRVRLVAQDADLAIGDGPEVRGPALDLLMVATRRPPREGKLDGPGCSLL